MRTCPRCSTDAPDDAYRCPSCRTPLGTPLAVRSTITALLIVFAIGSFVYIVYKIYHPGEKTGEEILRDACIKSAVEAGAGWDAGDWCARNAIRQKNGL